MQASNKPPKSSPRAQAPPLPGASPRKAGAPAGNLTAPASAGFLAATTSSPATRLSQQAILAAEAARHEDDGSDSDGPDGGRSGLGKRLPPSVMGFGRRKDQESMPTDIPELVNDIKVDVYVRCVACAMSAFVVAST